MENSWNLDKTRRLFELVDDSEKSGKSLSHAFAQMAKESGQSEGSVRNYYYSQAKLFALIPELAEKMGVIPSKRRSKPFEVFSVDESEHILERALSAKAEGQSIRTVLFNMAGGDKTLALRLQNKYRSLLAHHRELVEKVMAKLGGEGKKYFDPYLKTVVFVRKENTLSAVLEKVEALSSSEKEALIRRILS